MQKRIAVVFFFILSISFRTLAQQLTTNKESARTFVQNFYYWYNNLYENGIPGSQKPDCECADIYALNTKPEIFDPVLRKAIIADYNAQKKVKDEIVGFDSDPFLSAQDVGFTYIAGNVKQVGNNFFIDIHRDLKGTSKLKVLRSEIAVIAEVTYFNGHWIFKNFLYPSQKETTNLIDILKEMHTERIKDGYEKI